VGSKEGGTGEEGLDNKLSIEGEGSQQAKQKRTKLKVNSSERWKLYLSDNNRGRWGDRAERLSA